MLPVGTRNLYTDVMQHQQLHVVVLLCVRDLLHLCPFILCNNDTLYRLRYIKTYERAIRVRF
jgi:hypothetical protein